MSRVRVKICGLTSTEEVAACRGADALGFVVATPSSPRNLDLGAARSLLHRVPPGTLKVVVTLLARPRSLREIVEELRPDALQVHQELPPEGWEGIRTALGKEVMLLGLLGVPSAGGEEGLLSRARALRRTPLDGVVLDTKLAGKSGGTGRTHDWGTSRRLRELLRPLPVILAGGITPQNVRQAIRRVEPDWIDVSSGVEEGGRKSPRKVAALLGKVRHEAE